MRVGIVSHHGGKPAGAERALMTFLDRAREHIAPVFFLFEDGEFAQLLRERYGEVRIVPMSRRVAASTRAGLRWGGLGDALALAFRLVGALKRDEIDVVLTNTMKAHVVGSIAARLSGTPCVNYLHDVPSGMARAVIRESSRLFATARVACSALTDGTLGLPRTTVVHAPIDLSVYASLPPPGEARAALGLPNDGLPVIGLVGRVLRWKGQDAFVRIAERVLREADAHFAIVGDTTFGGDDRYAGELRTQVRDARLEDRVHFVPWQDDVRRVYAALDIVCNCSSREPFGCTMIEALACGVPAVCFDDAGVCEVFAGDLGAHTVAAGDEDGFADVLVELIADPRTMDEARVSARNVAGRLDVALLTERFLSVIQTVMQSGGRRRSDGATAREVPT
jgi:glycosyltransferase involved in cell wall biosynthesis